MSELADLIQAGADQATGKSEDEGGPGPTNFSSSDPALNPSLTPEMQAILKFEVDYVMPAYAAFSGIGDEVSVVDLGITRELIKEPELANPPVYTVDPDLLPEESESSLLTKLKDEDHATTADTINDLFRWRIGKAWRVAFPTSMMI